MLTQKQIEDVKYLITSNNGAEAVKMLVDLTGCDIADAENLVFEYDYESDFELLLDKHWIESGVTHEDDGEQKIRLTRKEKISLVKIFGPTIVILIIVLLKILVK